MKKQRVWTREAFIVIFATFSSPSQTTFLLLVSPPEDEQQAGWPHPHLGGFLEGAGVDAGYSTVTDIAQVLWR